MKLRRRHALLDRIAPQQQVMFKSDSGWYIWTGESRDHREPNAYRPMRRWSPLDWIHRLRQELFGWAWFSVREPRLIRKIWERP